MATQDSACISLLNQYQSYLDTKAFPDGEVAHEIGMKRKNGLCSAPLSVGVIGGGMAGLYSAMLLQKYIPDAKVTVLEAENRVGGRVYTYSISPEPHQYFEAGAMRIPSLEGHTPVFQLIEHLNKEFPDDPITLTNFNTCPEGNRVFVNNTKQKDGRVMSTEYAIKHSSELGFPGISDSDDAGKIYKDALAKVAHALEADFESALLKYSHMTVHDYLSKELGWSHQQINCVEVMHRQTNDFKIGLIDMFFKGGLLSFATKLTWKTVEGGMSKLPSLCAEAIKKNGTVLLGAKVKSITYDEKLNLVRVGYTQPASKDHTFEVFDKVILAIPPPCIRAIPERPHFGVDLEHALRASHFWPVSKTGLRFHSRFWERSDLDLPPSLGGRSTTDLPSRWFVYPNHGIGEEGKGVLYVYNWKDDTQQWCLLSKVEKIQQALHDLQALYPEVDVAREYAGGECPDSQEFVNEAFCVDWSYGMTLYYPGQFISYFPSLVKPQAHGSVYFAGAHLSSTLGWVVSAMESARRAVQQLLLNTHTASKVEYLQF